jgi:hypothetical protein
MTSSYHALYIAGSIIAALVALAGTAFDLPLLYATLPGIIGGACAAVAAVRFLRNKEDLAGFIATICGFVYYQAFQGNPVMLPEFSASLAAVAMPDKLAGLFLGNLTTAMFLISYHAVSGLFGGALGRWIPKSELVSRDRCDLPMAVGFWVLLLVVAAPNVMFGRVIVGSINSILYQRMTWGNAGYSGYSVFGGDVGGSFANIQLWTTSLFLIWLYLLRSRYRLMMFVVGPLVLLWTAGVTMQGSRTYLVTVAVAIIVYLWGRPNSGVRALVHALWAVPLLFLLIQVATHFRSGGLQSVNMPELAERMFEIRGNEGTNSEIDGVEFFRTELIARGAAVNPMIGFLRGMVERPIEGVLMVVPRPLFPWKPVDKMGTEFNLFFQRVRLGVDADEAFLGASPGLIGRELIKYGFLGPFTLLFWMGVIMAFADRLFSVAEATDFHRIVAALLIAFFVAQARDFSPVWFIPFLPAGVVMVIVGLRASRLPLAAAPSADTEAPAADSNESPS